MKNRPIHFKQDEKYRVQAGKLQFKNATKRMIYASTSALYCSALSNADIFETSAIVTFMIQPSP